MKRAPLSSTTELDLAKQQYKDLALLTAQWGMGAITAGASWYCERAECNGEAHDGWAKHARTKQRPPDGDWFIWLIMAGRGWGKTLTGAHWLRYKALQAPGSEWAVVAPTMEQLWRNCVVGRSGLRAVFQESELRGPLPGADSGLLLMNGARLKFYTVDAFERIRGGNHDGAWCEELGSWRKPQAWYEALVPSVRVGMKPQIVITTTPRPTTLMRDLAGRDDGSVVITRGWMEENVGNLSPSAVKELQRRYAGTRIGRQELHGELLEKIEGAIWEQEWIDAERIERPERVEQLFEALSLSRVVIAVDPAGTSGTDSDETGIIVMGRDRHDRGYVLDDLSGQHKVDQWPLLVIEAYRKWRADSVVAEVNYGGDYIGKMLTGAGYSGQYRQVHATRGKAVRAEPIAVAYQQGRISHVGEFPELEQQLCEWVPGRSSYSPDRMDALVWAAAELRLTEQYGDWENLYQAPPSLSSELEPQEEEDNPWAEVYSR